MGYLIGPLFILFSKMCIDDDQKRSISAISFAKEKLGWMWILPIAYCPAWSDYPVWYKHLNCEGFVQSSSLYPSSSSLSLQKKTWNRPTCPSCLRSWQSSPCFRSNFSLCLHSYLLNHGSAWKREELVCREELLITLCKRLPVFTTLSISSDSTWSRSTYIKNESKTHSIIDRIHSLQSAVHFILWIIYVIFLYWILSELVENLCYTFKSFIIANDIILFLERSNNFLVSKSEKKSTCCTSK